MGKYSVVRYSTTETTKFLLCTLLFIYSLCIFLGTLDIPRFRKLHTDVCEKLTSLCEKWNAKRTLLENLYGDFEEGLLIV